MTRKEELLQSFQKMDITLLERLLRYSQLLIIPEEDLCTNVTMVQMVDKAHQLADSLFPEWQDRSKSDFGEFLVELMAMFSEKDFWYINAFANEGLLSKTRSYSNAYAKAIQLGYTPKTFKGAEVQFNVTFAPGDKVTYTRGSLVINYGGTKFTNVEPFTLLSTSQTAESVKLREGTHTAEDLTFNGYSILLARTSIDIESVRVVIDNIEYTRVTTFGFSEATSPHYVLLPEENGSVSIFFGSDGFGMGVPVGKTVHVEYLKSKGSDWDTPDTSEEPTIGASIPSRSAIAVTDWNVLKLGQDGESFPSIREKAPLFFTTKKSAINESTAEALLRSYPFVKKAKVIFAGGDIIYRVIPVSGALNLNSMEKQELVESFEPTLLMGYKGIYSDNSYVDFLERKSLPMLYLAAYVSKGYNVIGTEMTIRQCLTDLTSPLVMAEYGGGFHKLSFDSYIKGRASGVQNIVWTDPNGVPIEDFEISDTEIFSPINLAKVVVNTYVL